MNLVPVDADCFPNKWCNKHSQLRNTHNSNPKQTVGLTGLLATVSVRPQVWSDMIMDAFGLKKHLVLISSPVMSDRVSHITLTGVQNKVASTMWAFIHHLLLSSFVANSRPECHHSPVICHPAIIFAKNNPETGFLQNISVVVVCIPHGPTALVPADLFVFRIIVHEFHVIVGPHFKFIGFNVLNKRHSLFPDDLKKRFYLRKMTTGNIPFHGWRSARTVGFSNQCRFQKHDDINEGYPDVPL